MICTLILAMVYYLGEQEWLLFVLALVGWIAALYIVALLIKMGSVLTKRNLKSIAKYVSLVILVICPAIVHDPSWLKGTGLFFAAPVLLFQAVAMHFAKGLRFNRLHFPGADHK